MSYEALKVLRPFVKIGSAIAPRLTGNLAFEAFCRPPRLDLDDAQKKLIARAEKRLAHGKSQRVSFAKGNIQTYQFAAQTNPSRGTILLIHGWTGRAAFMSAFVDPLTQSGFDVVAVDLPAHGASSGRTLHIPLAVEALHSVNTLHGPLYGIIGHSFGAAVATCLIAGAVEPYPALPVNRLALIAAPNSLPYLFHWFGRFVGLSDKAQRWFNANVLRLSGRELSTFMGEELLKQAQTETLVLHAPDDKEVAFSEAEALARAGDHVSLQPLPGLGHRRILYAPQTVEAVCNFMIAGPS